MSDVLIPQLPRCHFDKSKKRIGSITSGVLYPIYSKITSPGETLNINVQAVIRRLPTISPSFAEDKLILRAFKVPIRTLWPDWKSWLMGIKEYSDDIPYEGDVPRWIPSSISVTGPRSLWKLLGYPVNTLPTTPPADFKRQAYAWIRDVYFRYRPVQETALEEGKPGTWKGEGYFRVNKDRDYFTTGLTQQQVGEPVSLPITGDTKAVWDNVFTDISDIKQQVYYKGDRQYAITANAQSSPIKLETTGTGIGEIATETTIESNLMSAIKTDNGTTILTAGTGQGEKFKQWLESNTVSLKDVSSATIAMIRHAFAKQMQAENMARIGAFYPDVLKLNWGTAPSDDILGYPIYCGGFKMNIVNSEVLQTAPSTDMTPLGDMGGHGLGVGASPELNIHSDEHCVVMIIAYIKSENFYGGQQLPFEDMFVSNDDMLWIAYQHISEQPVKKQELCCISKKFPYIENGTKKWGNEDPTAEDYNEDTLFFMPYGQWAREDYNDVFGLMVKEILYTKADGSGELKEINNLYNWTQANFFSIKDGQRPAFNANFIGYVDDMRNYAVQYKDIEGKINEDQYIVWFNFKVDSYQVLDKDGTPGKIDHLGEI